MPSTKDPDSEKAQDRLLDTIDLQMPLSGSPYFFVLGLIFGVCYTKFMPSGSGESVARHLATVSGGHSMLMSWRAASIYESWTFQSSRSMARG
jgi:hypothetical protein